MTTATSRREDGFFNRGDTQTRLETFVDAAFAFVMTLLVISFNDIPKNSTELIEALKGIPAFAASFVLLTQFWMAHNNWCRRYGLDDQRMTVLSIMLVFLVLIFVYPLRVQFASLFYWISNGWLPSTYSIANASDLQIMFLTFAVSFGAMSLCFALLYRHAWNQANRIGLDAFEHASTKLHTWQWAINVVVALVSIVLSLSYEPGPSVLRATAGGMVLFLLQLASLLFAIQHRRLRRRYLEASTAKA
ncbi:DUF1211 domain-containing protein [Ahniella affigens]|uniref:DUF1211 domain-containing protein n=1 Tax=Ahniella affigens TaxID=2021234 RepID=A0A2P1PN17_9GAMM|nr:TMEM175 family protein [Ahniella affigens]AVP96229.1 DUF1211 domain-containing protein [Ahniella affigens]